MPRVTANGVTFNFPDGINNEQIGSAIDEYFAENKTQNKIPQGVDPDVPTDENLALSEAQAKPETTLGQDILGAGEAALTLGTSATGGALGQGLGNLYTALGEVTGLLKPQTGDNPLTTNFEPTKGEELAQALTYQPRTQAGQEIVQDITEPLSALPPYLGVGGAANVGQVLKQLKAPSKNTKTAMSEVAPTQQQLKDAATKLYQEVEEANIQVPKNDYLNFAIKLNNNLRKNGLDSDLTPKTSQVLNRIEKDYEAGKTGLTDLEQVRKLADVPAKQFDNPTEQRLASIIKDSVDDFVDAEASKREGEGGNVGELYRGARNLTQRRKKMELIDEAVLRANEAASGFENGLRNEFRSILKNKKKRRGFTEEEKKSMQQITQGGKLENTFKKLGKIGFGADQQTNMLLGVLGSALGASIGGVVGGGAGAGVGALAFPAIGQLSANAAKKLADKNQKYAIDLIASGKNGGSIIDSYIKNVPKRQQSKEELAALLLDPSVDISTVRDLAAKYKSQKNIVDDAIFIADKLKNAQLAAYAASLGAENFDQPNDKQE